MTASADPSIRFVLAPDAPFVENLAALWEADAMLARRVEQVEVGESHRVEPSKHGEPTLAVVRDSRTIYLHSKYQPLEEAKKSIDRLLDERPGAVAFFVMGLGLGHHVAELFERIGPESRVYVFEPDERVVRAAIEHGRLEKALASRRLHILVDVDKPSLFNLLTQQSALLLMGTATLKHAASVQLHGEYFERIATWLEEFESFARTSLNTLVINGRRTAENIARNLAWYAASPCIGRLKGAMAGQPAVIVSAGPSLRKNRHLLRDLQGRAVLIAVQTTLQPLLELGVEPHFVTSLDYHDICTRFFEKLPPTLRTELVAEPKATPKIFSLFPGALTLNGNEFADALLREMQLGRKQLPAGATVAHLAYYLAEHLGCDPIIFVGQDLGFSDGLCYTPGTSYEDVWRPELSRFCTLEMKQWEQIARDRPILRRIPDIEGRPMYTEQRLFTYLQQFERDFARSRAKIIDATEGGALKRGAEPMRLAEVIERFCRCPLSVETPPHPGMRWDRIAEAADCVARRREEAVQIERISDETLPLLGEIRDSLRDRGKVNRIIAKVDVLRNRISEFGQTFDLVMQMSQSTELKRFQDDRRIMAAKVEGIELQRRQVERDIENVRGVAEAARAFVGLMDEVAALLREGAPA